MRTRRAKISKDLIVPNEERFRRFGLSIQESRVLSLAMEGKTDREIAEIIGVVHGTVRVYWKRLRDKTGATRSETIARMSRDIVQADFEGVRVEVEDLRRKLEERQALDRLHEAYESAFRLLPSPFALVDGETTKIILSNESFAAHFGLKVEETEGRSLLEWIPFLSGLPKRSGGAWPTFSVPLGGGKTLKFVGGNAAVFAAWIA